MASPRPIQQHLANGIIAQLVAHTRDLQAIGRLMQPCLPADLSPHIRLADWSNGRLVLQLDSSSWATRLRYTVPQLIQSLRKMPELADLRQIDLYVAPQSKSAVKTNQPLHLSSAGATAIEAGAATISDPALRAALRRLARRAC